MTQTSEALRQAVFQAIACAQSAAAIDKTALTMAQVTHDAFLKNEVKKISEAAYAASAHAWMAMIALSSRQLDVAQSALQAASNAEQVVLQRASLLNLPHSKSRHYHHDLPDERALNEMWNELCASLPDGFPVPDALDQTLSV